MVEETGDRLTHTELMLAEEFGVISEQTTRRSRSVRERGIKRKLR